MNMTHQVWMTLPPGEVPGRGERIAAVAADRGLRPHVAFVLGHAEGMLDIHVRDGSPRSSSRRSACSAWSSSPRGATS